jgi:Na+-transporting NADH:ubiquinone oxidoreductase subunit NqrD
VAKVALVVLVVGVVGILLGGGTLLVSVLLPVLTEGRTSWDEAMLGVIPGAVLLALSFFVALVGLIVMILKRKKKAQA